jgi:hypothetical protein
METVFFLVGAAVVAAVGVWARARFGTLRGALLAVAIAVVVIAVWVGAFGEGPEAWVALLVLPVVFVVQTITERVTGKANA